MKKKLLDEFIHIHDILQNKAQHAIAKLFVCEAKQW